MDRLRRVAGIAIALAVTGCLETYAPPERGPVVPPVYDEVTIDPTHGFAPVVLLEGGTGIHVVYIAEALPDWGGPYPLAYAGCAGGCESASHWRTGAFDSILGNLPAAAVLAGGALHVVYPVSGRSGMVLRYASCKAGCDAPANWLRTDLDSALYVQPALAAGTGDTLRLIYAKIDSTARVLRYASCAAACATASNWIASTIDTALAVAAVPSMALGANGDLHVVFTEGGESESALNGQLWYGACSSGCGSGSAWHFVAIDSGYPLSAPSLVVGAGTTVLVAYSTGYSDTRIATCRSACGNAPSWAADTLIGLGSGPKIATGPTDTLYLVATGQYGSLSLASCSGDCELASDWNRRTFGNGVGPNIIVDLVGHPRVAFEGDFALRMVLFR